MARKNTINQPAKQTGLGPYIRGELDWQKEDGNEAFNYEDIFAEDIYNEGGASAGAGAGNNVPYNPQPGGPDPALGNPQGFNDAFQDNRNNVKLNVPSSVDDPNTHLTSSGATGSYSETDTQSGASENTTQTQQGTTQNFEDSNRQAQTTNQNYENSATDRTQGTASYQDSNTEIAEKGLTKEEQLRQNWTDEQTQNWTDEQRQEWLEALTQNWQDTKSSTQVDDNLGFAEYLRSLSDEAEGQLTRKNDLLAEQADGGNLTRQVQDAVKASLSGPQAQMAGGSALARMGSRAAAETANAIFGNQVNAASAMETGQGVDAARVARDFTGETTTGRASGTETAQQGATEVGKSSGTEVGKGSSTETGNTFVESLRDVSQNQSVTGYEQIDETINNIASSFGSEITDEQLSSMSTQIQDLVSNTNSETEAWEALRGMSLGQMFGQSFGTQPEGGGGGKVLCTLYTSRKMLEPKILAGDLAFSLKLSERIKRGYRRIADPIVNYMLDKPSTHISFRLLHPLVKGWAEEMASRVGVCRPNFIGKIVYTLGLPVCWLAGSVK